METAVQGGGVQSVRPTAHTHHRMVSLATLTWATLAIVAVMGALYFIVGFPPAFDTYLEIMYFHAIGIGLAALAAYLIIAVYKLDQVEPDLDFPLAYRAFWAVCLGALGGLVYLSPSINNALPDIGLLLFILAFIFIGDVGGALLVELFLLPRKLAGNYSGQTSNLFDYVGRVVPVASADRASYRAMNSGYWLALISVAGAFLAGIAGFVNLWLRLAGASVFAPYMSWLGLDTSGFQGATLDPHSHLMALSIMAGIVAAAAVAYGVLKDESRLRRTLARVGLWIAIIGVAGTSAVMMAIAFLNFAPPTFFTNGPDGVNGMAGDDAMMSVIGVGAMIVVVAIAIKRETWRDWFRLIVLGSWVAAMILNVVEGFWIEFHEDQFQNALATNDASFSIAQPMTGIFLLTGISLLLLIVEHYGVAGRLRAAVAAFAGLGLLGAFFGTTLWTFADPSNNGISFAIYVAGTALVYIGMLVGAAAIQLVRVRQEALARP
jgi:hypothetical protein